MPIYTIEFTKAAQRNFAALPKKTQERIDPHILALATNPRPTGCEKLQGQKQRNYYRIRVGDYRVIYQIEDAQLVILVVNLGHRKEIYR